MSTVALVAAIAIGGCGPASSGVQGISCNVDADCNSGLSCLPFYPAMAAGEDAGCTMNGRVCQQPCKSSSDCTVQGYACLMSCGGSTTCLPEPVSTDAAADAVPDSVTDATSDLSSQ